jgi:Ku70/Ku80 beta-barrel domain
VADEELDNLALESTKIIDLEKFVPRSEIDERYLDSPYYLTPEDEVGQDAFAVIREAMTRKNMVGLGKVVISRRERIVDAGAARQRADGDDPFPRALHRPRPQGRPPKPLCRMGQGQPQRQALGGTKGGKIEVRR